MALTQIPIELSSTPSIVDGGNATAITINSSEEVTFAAKVTAIGTSVFTNLDISGNIDVDGITNLDAVDIDGAVNMATTALVTGVLTTTAATVHTNGITMPDSAKAIFGAGNDLQIYHDGSNSIIADVGTGHLKLLGNDLRINNADSSKSYLSATNGGSVILYHNAANKLETAAGGVTVAGTATATNLILNTSANSSFSIINGGTNAIAMKAAAGDELYIGANNSYAIRLLNNGTNDVVMDNSSSLGIGTASVATWTKLHLYGTAGAQTGATQALYLHSPTATANQGTGIRMSAASGSHEAVGIIGVVNNASGNSGSMTFHTYSGGGDIPERMRLTDTGSLSVAANGATVNTNSNFHSVRNGKSNEWIQSLHCAANPPYGLSINYTAAATNGTSNYFLYCADTGASRFYVESNGNVKNRNSSYTGISDLKLKQDIVDASNQWDDIKNIRFRKYKFKTDVVQFGEDAVLQLGVIAQELESAGMSGLVSESPDIEIVFEPVLDESGNATVDEDGNPITEEQTRKTGTTTKAVNYSVMNMKAMVALQEAMARIETLEAKVTALENN